jgi:hypothetical protein
MLTLRSTTGAELRNNWDFVEQGLKTIIRKTNSNFIAADIYASIIAKGLFLYWIVDDEYTVGFTVVSEAATSYNGTKSLYLDHTYIDPKYMRSGLIEDLDLAFEDLAVKCDCTSLEFNSPRMGWGRRLKRIGWMPYTVVYKRDL